MVEPILHIHICTYGQDGVNRVVKHNHPEIEGVRWLLSVQSPLDKVKIPHEITSRKDFDVIIHKDKGLSVNRNHALDYKCDSEYILIADDDVDYSKEGINKLMKAFRDNPNVDIICGRYKSEGKYIKIYGENQFNLKYPPKGWYVSSIEIAFRRYKGKEIRFNENLGAGSDKLIAGEESVWLYDMLKNGATGIFLPIDLGEHNELTTSERMLYEPLFHQTKGAVMIHIKPISWFPRLILYSYRSPAPFFKCLIESLKGVHYAISKKIYTSKVSLPVDKRKSI